MFNRWPPILVPSLTASSPPVARSAAAALSLIESILMASFRRASCSAIYLMNTSAPLMINERLIFRLPAANIFSLGGNVRFGFMVGTDSLLVSPDRCLERRRQTSITLMESSRYPFYPDIKGSGRIVFRFRNNFFFNGFILKSAAPEWPDVEMTSTFILLRLPAKLPKVKIKWHKEQRFHPAADCTRVTSLCLFTN